VFRSGPQAALLTELYLSGHSLTAASLARAAGVDPRAVAKWLPDLELAGVIRADRTDTHTRYSANESAPFYPALRALLEVTYGPPKVVGEELADVAGIDQIFIFGSWAERAADIVGPMPHDVDILVIGDPDRSALAAAIDRAAERLRRPVNPLLTTPPAWVAASDPLLDVVKKGPLVGVPHERIEHARSEKEQAGNRAAAGTWESANLAHIG
jgi:predicted nucleotidyltransferase